jgi:hypothetical protein
VWFCGLPNNSIHSWDEFHTAFMKRWVVHKDGRMLLAQLHEIKKKENETVKEFDDRFRKLVDVIPKESGRRMTRSSFTTRMHMKDTSALC